MRMVKVDSLHAQYSGPGIIDKLDEIRDSFLATATGRGQVPIDTFKEIIATITKSYKSIINMLLAVVIGLLTFFTGMKIFFPDLLTKILT